MARTASKMMSTLDRAVETIASPLIPRSRREDLRDLAEARPPDYASQILDCTIRAIWDKTRCALFPAIAVDRGDPSPEEKRKRFDHLCKHQRWSVLLFISAYLAHTAVAASMLPQSASIQFFAPLLQLVVLGFALRLQRGALTPAPAGRPAIAMESPDPDRYRRELLHKKDMLMLGDFSPAASAVRSGAIAMMVMLTFFAPAYPVLRWFAFGFLPDGVRWLGVAGAFASAAILAGWLRVIWKSSRLAADAFQKEILALDAARKTP